MTELADQTQAARWIDAIQIGDDLPSMEFTPTYLQLVVYAGTSRDYFEIHHDRDAAKAAGFPDVIVQGSLKAAWLCQVVTGWAGDDATLREFSVQYRGIDHPDRTVVARGRVAAKPHESGPETMGVELWLENAEGKRTTTGYAVVSARSTTS